MLRKIRRSSPNPTPEAAPPSESAETKDVFGPSERPESPPPESLDANPRLGEKVSIVRPGYLVMLRSTLKGGVFYDKLDLDSGKTEAQLVEEASVAGASMPDVRTWQTTRTINDPEEFARGSKARSVARSLVARACIATSFGLICPVERVAELDEAAREATRLSDEFNCSARHSRLRVYVLKGRIAGTDEEAGRAIVAEVRDLLDEMREGIQALDPVKIRDAADKAARVGAMLADDQKEKVAAGVEEARRAARIIVKRVEKGGERGADVLAEIQRGAIEKARFAFLDLDEAREVEPLPAVDLQRFDLDGLDAAAGEE